jgi:hypothetical protein
MIRPLLPAALALALTLAPAAARAYRPFDQTDAEVADRHEFELELGPFAALHDSEGTALAPGFVLNYGLLPRVELVVEDHNRIPVDGSSSQTFETEPSVLLKGVLREGVLQAQTGPSIAFEAGLLLPSQPHPDGFGTSSTVIVSGRWPAGTVHANLEVAYSRDHHLDALGGAIVEGPHDWRIRPVAEAYVERERPGVTIVSALGGAIWEVREHLSVDAAARAARIDATPAVELRLGLTWAFAL